METDVEQKEFILGKQDPFKIDTMKLKPVSRLGGLQ
jgi:hypothetical protein